RQLARAALIRRRAERLFALSGFARIRRGRYRVGKPVRRLVSEERVDARLHIEGEELARGFGTIGGHAGSFRRLPVFVKRGKSELRPFQSMIPKKPAPDLIRGGIPVFGKDHAPTINWSEMTIRHLALRRSTWPTKRFRLARQWNSTW